MPNQGHELNVCFVVTFALTILLACFFSPATIAMDANRLRKLAILSRITMSATRA
jgi:hypothetical protein